MVYFNLFTLLVMIVLSGLGAAALTNLMETEVSAQGNATGNQTGNMTEASEGSGNISGIFGPP
jgi:hypothetical protein